jgi:hypothetical protein
MSAEFLFVSISGFWLLREKIIIEAIKTKISVPITPDDMISFPQVSLSKVHPLFVEHY